MSSSEFSSLLGNIIYANMGGDIFPEPWINCTEAQVFSNYSKDSKPKGTNIFFCSLNWINLYNMAAR